MSITLGGDNSFFMELYSRYRRDRNSVPIDWVVYFETLGMSEEQGAVQDSASYIAASLLGSYRRYGHLEAQLDPLHGSVHREPILERMRQQAHEHADAEVELTIAGSKRHMRIGDAARTLQLIYAGHVGLEVEQLGREEDVNWWYTQFERIFSEAPDASTVRCSLESVVLADEFESFMRVKFPTKKRFGVEGAESSIVFLRELLRAAPEVEIDEMVLGGMHRGRLATLAVGLGKNPATLAAELMGRDLSEGASFTGDVPYHLGFTSQINYDNRRLDLTLLPHPSHLMVVAPVALGLARATGRGKTKTLGRTLCLLLHTDAAFSGQGVTSELLQLGALQGYSASGAIHLVVNNQIGFTTLPSEGRSARYCTDIGKMVGAPVLHVNGDDPVAVARVARLAVAWNQHSGKDILIDLVCYRRHGHNELDEPRFTQPDTWKAIDGHPTVREQLLKTVATDAVDLQKYAERVAGEYRARLQAGFDSAANIAPNDEPIQASGWNLIPSAGEDEILQPVMTGIEIDQLRRIGLAATTIPDGFNAHAKVRLFYEARAASIRNGEAINFASAEALAFATLLANGSPIRLSGQDSVRGTFTQRHLVVHDTVNNETFIPLAAVEQAPNALEVINSPLSEYGVLAFEYGHSLLDPNHLTIWEAQFGDFINGAQIVVDQYITSAESKWRLRSGLVMLLPHGLEGQGPDHSSARIERLTQLCAGGNIVVAQPTSPANLFHLLRRQIMAPWRKPLFVIAPKSLLRAKAAVSTLADMAEGTTFQPIIVENRPASGKVRRVVLCSGKIFYALEQSLHGTPNEERIAIVRIEQIYPFPVAAVKAALNRYPDAECVWLQEEPENQGAWPLLQGELSRANIRLSAVRPVISRPAMSVSAGGSIERHEREQHEILSRAVSLDMS